ncbi:MAG: hypothetical protein ACLFSQ_05210 [Candidatus Zixiibacteriota bacterium]
MFDRYDDIFYLGPEFTGKPIAVMNSRQGKFFRENDSWIQKTKEAMEYAACNDYTILTSIGLSTYDITTYLSSEYRCKKIIVLPLRDEENPVAIADKISEDFNLYRELTGFLFFQYNGPKNRPKAWWPKRDDLIIENSEIIFPISIRPNGKLSQAIQDSKVDSRFGIEYKPISRSIKNKLSSVKAEFTYPGWDYLTHWTHSSEGPAAGENHADFYHDIMRSGNKYARSAEKALLRIIFEGKIFGSNRNLRGNGRAVSFTANNPSEMLESMRYRNRFCRTGFEPYGLAIKKHYAKFIGMRPVVYGDNSKYKNLSQRDKFYFQAEGKNGIWRKEKEWRYPGDFDFSIIPKSKIIILVPNEQMVKFFRPITSFEILSLT